METSEAAARGRWILTSDARAYEDDQSADPPTPSPPLNFEEIYRRLRAPVLGWATKCLRNRQDAEDVVSEAFEALRKALPRIQSRSEKAVDAYLYTIVRNLIARPRRQTEPFQEDKIPAVDTPEDDPIWLTTTPEELENAIARLPAADRDIIVLALLDQLPHREIATRLSLPSANAVAIKLYRAKQALRVLVQEELARRPRDRISHAQSL